MDIQGRLNLGQKCPDISHAVCSFISLLEIQHMAFIPLVVGEKVLITFQQYDVCQWVRAVVVTHSSLLRLYVYLSTLEI